MRSADDQLKRKILGCWTGKNIGGTLGGPYEGVPGTHELTFYDPVPSEPLPNDDLDLQILFLEYLLNHYQGSFSPAVLQQAWADHCVFPWDEYGICRRNTQLGLSGVDVGAVDNWFADGMGAAIRTELWACVSPGNPGRAAGFAWADAVCDHAADGVWATVFVAAMESQAFVESDRFRLIECGLSYIPEQCRVASAVRFAMDQWNELRELIPVRDALVERFGTTNFTDVAANMGIIVLAWLAGDGDFGKTLCNAVNCGLDTDCTCATLGALLGIIDPEGIPQEWKAPVGNEIKLSPGLSGITPPATLEELTNKTICLSDMMAGEQPVVGEVRPRSMGGHALSVTHEPASISVFEKERLDGTSLAHKAQLPGHWFDVKPLVADEEAVLLNFTFTLDRDSEVRLMAYYRHPAKVWLNGETYAVFRPEDWHEGFHAPSFHRFEKFAPSRALSKGTHSFTVALTNPRGGASDVVVGVGDASGDLWISKALLSS